VCGALQSGKSTLAGRLLNGLGKIPPRSIEKIFALADMIGRRNLSYAFLTDTLKCERERCLTVSCTTTEFFTESNHYTIVDVPGHSNFIKNMITGASHSDVALLVVDETFYSARNDKRSMTYIQARLLFCLGVTQLIVCINKMDHNNYNQNFYEKLKENVSSMLVDIGWSREKINKSVPFLPTSGFQGDNILKVSEYMGWWKGCTVKSPLLSQKDESVHVLTLEDCLEKMVVSPKRANKKPLRMPVSAVYNIQTKNGGRGGDVIAGFIEQGSVAAGDELIFLPTHTSSKPRSGKVVSIEMHHRPLKVGYSGDAVGLKIEGLVKENMPRVGDVIIKKNDNSLKACKSFTMTVIVFDEPSLVPLRSKGTIKVGYCPTAFSRAGRAACRITKINWSQNKRQDPRNNHPKSIKRNQIAEIVFEPQHPFVVEAFGGSNLGRIFFMDGNFGPARTSGIVMAGVVSSVEFMQG
jgi:elongation factor 1-alpha